MAEKELIATLEGSHFTFMYYAKAIEEKQNYNPSHISITHIYLGGIRDFYARKMQTILSYPC